MCVVHMDVLLSKVYTKGGSSFRRLNSTESFEV